MKIIRSAGSEKIQLILNDSVTHEIKSGLTATLATFSFPLNKKKQSDYRTGEPIQVGKEPVNYLMANGSNGTPRAQVI